MNRIPRIPLSALPKPVRIAVTILLTAAALAPVVLEIDTDPVPCTPATQEHVDDQARSSWGRELEQVGP